MFITAIRRSIEKAEGLRALGRELDWNAGAICRVLDGEKISAFRAAQRSDYLGGDRFECYCAAFQAVEEQAKSKPETLYWKHLRADLEQKRARAA